jgi:peroxiredoxin
LRALGTTALLIGAGGVGTGLVRSMALPFPVLIDTDRATYRAYGLTRALHLFQESATVLVDRDGLVRHATYAHNPNASMEWERLLGDVRALARASAPGGTGRADS